VGEADALGLTLGEALVLGSGVGFAVSVHPDVATARTARPAASLRTVRLCVTT
jgi:hypothetical protein